MFQSLQMRQTLYSPGCTVYMSWMEMCGTGQQRCKPACFQQTVLFITDDKPAPSTLDKQCLAGCLLLAVKHRAAPTSPPPHTHTHTLSPLSQRWSEMSSLQRYSHASCAVTGRLKASESLQGETGFMAVTSRKTTGFLLKIHISLSLSLALHLSLYCSLSHSLNLSVLLSLSLPLHLSLLSHTRSICVSLPLSVPPLSI